MRPLHPADPPLSTLTEDAIPSVQEQLLDRTRRAGLARSLAEHREPTPQAVAAAPGSHDARRGSREVGSSSVAIRHSHAECALRGPLVSWCGRVACPYKDAELAICRVDPGLLAV